MEWKWNGKFSTKKNVKWNGNGMEMGWKWNGKKYDK